MKYIVKEVFTTKRDTLLSSWIEQARDEQRQADEYIKSKLGDNYKREEVYPPKRKKIRLPRRLRQYLRLDKRNLHYCGYAKANSLCAMRKHLLRREFFDISGKRSRIATKI